MPPRRDCRGIIPGSNTRQILGCEPDEQSPWTPGPLGINDWTDPNRRHAKRQYAQAVRGKLPVEIKKTLSKSPSLVTGKIDFLILELGPDQKDSITFKKAMEAQKLGRDLTPKLAGLKRGTEKQGVTYLSALQDTDFVTPQFRQWLRNFAACKPVILYISGHHADSRPIFFNDNDCGIFFENNRIKVGKYVSIAFMDIFTKSGRQTIEESSTGLSENIVAIIGDACSLVSSGLIAGGASKLQAALSNKHGKPILFGFRDKSPASGTGQLHASFVSCLAKKLQHGSITRQDIVDCWIASGKRWSNAKYKKNLGVLGSDGKFYRYDGKPLEKL